MICRLYRRSKETAEKGWQKPFSPTRSCTKVPREVGKTANFRLYDRERRLGRLSAFAYPFLFSCRKWSAAVIDSLLLAFLFSVLYHISKLRNTTPEGIS